MKKNLFAIILCVFSILANAQSLTPQVIASAGNSSTVGNVNLSYTVGEMAMVETFANGNTILTQGFQQPEFMVSSILESEKTALGSFAVYPNPANAEVFFGYEFPNEGSVEVAIYDVAGKFVSNVWTEIDYVAGKSIHSFQCDKLASGNYVVSANFIATNGSKQTLSKKVQVVK